MRATNAWLLFLALAIAAPQAGASENGAPAEDHGQKPEEAARAAHHDQDRERMTEHHARTSSRDVKIPLALVARIEKEYKDFLAKQKDVPKKDNIKRGLLNITAELTQRNKAALNSNTRVNTPTGGGVIDLNDLVTPLRGAFRAKLIAEREDGTALPASRVFFVSRAKERTIGGESYGSGCGKFMEITSQFHKKWAKKGMEVYTADQRYVSVLGGTFVFVDYAPEALFVGTVTFMDSRYPELMCEG